MYCFKKRYAIWFLFLFGYLIISLIIIKVLKNFPGASICEKDNSGVSHYLKDSNFMSFRGERVVHLDLKGAPPSVDYLKSIFPLFHALGATSLLIEYEDMFPYSDRYARAINAYSKDDIESLLEIANIHHLNVIPLVQTFGHLEFLLKLKKFSHFREESKYPQSICPSHNDTFSILTGLLDEIIEAHPHIRYIHIGCDEVYQLGLCPKCNEKMSANQWHRDDLFLDHVSHLAKYVRSKYPTIIPLMWDDQLRSISLDKLKNFNIGTLVEPVIWFYKPVISLSSNMWKKYAQLFSSVWVASSFKGATGSDKIITDINYHVRNQISWMYVMREYANLINFKGMVITGWQRYDHFAVLCELLPVSIPSLVHVASILDGPRSVRKNFAQKMRNVIACETGNDISESCDFPSSNVYLAVHKFSKLKMEIDDIFSSSPVRGWLTAYNVKTNYFNKLLAEELTHKMKECQTSLASVEAVLRESLKTVYDEYTITEWMQTNVQPYVLKLNHMSRMLHNLTYITEWRPRYQDSTLKVTN